MITRFKYTVLGFALISLAFSCKSTKNAQEAEAPADSAAPIEETAEVPTSSEQPTERTFFASIVRTACFGTCPIYNMTIYSDGYVEYNGIRFVPKLGEQTGQIPVDQLQHFVDKANEIEFMEMEDEYDSPITDLPSATTTIVLNGKKKSVRRRHNYPQRILQFEVLFDDLIETVEWTPVKPPSDR